MSLINRHNILSTWTLNTRSREIKTSKYHCCFINYLRVNNLLTTHNKNDFNSEMTNTIIDWFMRWVYTPKFYIFKSLGINYRLICRNFKMQICHRSEKIKISPSCDESHDNSVLNHLWNLTMGWFPFVALIFPKYP